MILPFPTHRLSLLSPADVESLILAACAAGPTTEDQLVRFVNWANDALTIATLVELAKKGKMSVDVRNEDAEEWEWRKR